MLAVHQQPPQDIGIPALKVCISLTDEGLHRSYCQRAAEVEECTITGCKQCDFCI